MSGAKFIGYDKHGDSRIRGHYVPEHLADAVIEDLSDRYEGQRPKSIQDADGVILDPGGMISNDHLTVSLGSYDVRCARNHALDVAACLRDLTPRRGCRVARLGEIEVVRFYGPYSIGVLPLLDVPALLSALEAQAGELLEERAIQRATLAMCPYLHVPEHDPIRRGQA